MKKLLLIFVLCFAYGKGFGQEKYVKKVTLFEMGIGFGIALPLSHANHYKSRMGDDPLKIIPGLNYEWEIRINLPGRPHSIGVQYNLADFHKHRGESCEQGSLANVGLFYDYNFRQGANINPFAGFRIGYSYAFYGLVHTTDNVNDIGYTPLTGGNYHAICFTPRIGVEFFKHLRLTFSMTFIDKKTSFYGFTLGAVIGGGTRTKAVDSNTCLSR